VRFPDWTERERERERERDGSQEREKGNMMGKLNIGHPYKVDC